MSKVDWNFDDRQYVAKVGNDTYTILPTPGAMPNLHLESATFIVSKNGVRQIEKNNLTEAMDWVEAQL